MAFKPRDVTGMSYEELQDYVFELEAMISAMEEQRALEGEFNLRRYFNLTETEGRILALMSDGRVRDKNSLLTLAYGGSDDTPGIKNHGRVHQPASQEAEGIGHHHFYRVGVGLCGR
jgi:hypothetical protein